MSKKNSPNLNDNEKNEIKNDVKDAFGKALSKRPTSIEQTINDGTEETLNQQEVDKIIKKTKNKKHTNDIKPIIITIILIVLITISGLYIYFSNNPKTIFIKTIDKSFNIIEKNIYPKEQKTKGNINIDYNTKSGNQTLDSVNMKIAYQLDTKEKISNIDLTMNDNKEQLLNAKIYSEKDKTYLYSESILNNFIELENKTILTKKQTNTILHSLNKAITKSIENEKFEGSQKQIDINGKITKTYKSTLIIDKNNKNEILKSITENLKQDKKFINTLEKITNKTQQEISTSIENSVSTIKESLMQADTMSINIYTKGAGQEFVKLEINKITNGQTNTTTITKQEKNKYIYLIDDQTKNEKLAGNIEYTSDKNNMILKLDIKKEGTNPSQTNIVIKNKSQKLDKITKIDTSNSIKLDELTQTDKLNIFTK